MFWIFDAVETPGCVSKNDHFTFGRSQKISFPSLYLVINRKGLSRALFTLLISLFSSALVFLEAATKPSDDFRQASSRSKAVMTADDSPSSKSSPFAFFSCLSRSRLCLNS